MHECIKEYIVANTTLHRPSAYATPSSTHGAEDDDEDDEEEDSEEEEDGDELEFDEEEFDNEVCARFGLVCACEREVGDCVRLHA